MNIFILIFVFLIYGFTSCKCLKVAMCITGMAARFQPHHLENFFKLNSDISFHLFYRFQDDSSLVYSYYDNFKYDSSVFSAYNKTYFKIKLFEAYNNLTNVHIESINYTKPKSKEEWKKIIGPNMNVIVSTSSIQSNVLNTYDKIDHCSVDIREFKSRNNAEFDYLIQTREDIFLFKLFKLHDVISKYHKCDWIGKSCLSWGGLSQRFNIMPFSVGLKFISSKIDYFKQLADKNEYAENTEIFDFKYSKFIGMKTCLVSIDDVPATAARHTHNGSFCFTPGEVKDCYPNDYQKFVAYHACK